MKLGIWFFRIIISQANCSGGDCTFWLSAMGRPGEDHQENSWGLIMTKFTFPKDDTWQLILTFPSNRNILLQKWSLLQGPGAVVEGPKKGKGGAKKSGKVVKPWMRKKKPLSTCRVRWQMTHSWRTSGLNMPKVGLPSAGSVRRKLQRCLFYPLQTRIAP